MKVILKLCKVFDSPLEAHCGLTSAKEIENVPPSPSFSPIPIHHLSLTPPPCSPARIASEDSTMKAFCLFDPEEKKNFLGEALSLFAKQQYGVDIPESFVELSIKAMQRLSNAGKSNVVYSLCKGLGTPRPDQPDESLFPTSRMPMGLLEYMTEFFTDHTYNC